MQQFLAFRLHGVMASWGEVAVGPIRGSADHPTRSALIGLVGAALGVLRDDDDLQTKLAQMMRFAVRVDLPGVLMRDYHTTRVGQPDRKEWSTTRRESLKARRVHCIPSERYYYCDAHYTVIAWATDDNTWSLEDIAHALRHPHFVLCLGRKACPPGLPLEAHVFEAKTLREAFRGTHFELPPALHKLLPDRQRLIWEDTGQVPLGLTAEHVFDRRDDPISATRRHFGLRREYQTTLPREDTPCT